MARMILAAATAYLLSGFAVAAPADRGEDATAAGTAVLLAPAPVRPPATQMLRGVVDSVDQGSDTINIRLSSDAIERFKVQDGLIFNAVRFGDLVEISVRSIAGIKTIVELSKE
ncbi:hypothetical protein IC762_14745 [Bradyrhizobium genosp. L]|uniref:hypothetical protein n=1 Tax=Bradyrhizobium genosp. L TaxID=83637 RepID=UPI0018A292F9|nr:hypothetical protein [Bradyrhizobium genosp. L]QPF87464.1 hypothetical protein IC762_14745 [Bradyrhizobium genosp. L]